MLVTLCRLLSFVLTVVPIVLSATMPQLTAVVQDGNVPLLISWDKLDHILYSSAVLDESGSLRQFSSFGLRSVVHRAHANKKKVSLSIGGRTGSLHFSTLVSSAHKRRILAKTIANAVKEYELDGINIDWEFPNSRDGVSCDANAPRDSAHLRHLLRDVRRHVKNDVLLTASAVAPFNNRHQEPASHLLHSWSVLDGVYVMAYDFKNGTNAPLYSAYPGPPPSPSVDQLITAWRHARIPASKLILGVAFSGHIRSVDPAMYGEQARGDKYDKITSDPCPIAIPSYSGTYQYRSIVDLLSHTDTNGWSASFDTVTMTPMLVQNQSKLVLSYDDPVSLAAKVNYSLSQHLGGIMAMSLEMDDSHDSLLNSLQPIRSSTGH